MKFHVPAAQAALALLCLSVGGIRPAMAQNEEADALFPPVPSTSVEGMARDPLPELEKDAVLMQKRLDVIEARLGASPRPPSVAYNLERRLADLETRLQKVEQQMTRMQQWEQRIRRLEMQRP